ncbi:MAG: Holliday junction branch migration DNA helicase RuvB [Myxococcales bacterium]|nr:MAG: Holliday junction branch migration DNA helicase RuvB [Myxococcales bacterium]
MTEREDEDDLAPQRQDGERQVELSIRPKSFAEYIGQKKAIDNLSVFIQAVKLRRDVLDHMLLWSPPGLGKTTLAHIVANELGVGIYATSGPAIDRKGDLAGILSNLKRGDILFIDEIHRLAPVIEENLYPAMEDFTFDIIIGEGPHAKNIKLPLQPFTLIGATTRAGMLTSPLRDRFGIIVELSYYAAEELMEVVRRTSRVLGIAIDEEAVWEIARRSRGTPRITNRLLRRVRDFADVAGQTRISLELARHGLDKLEIDAVGLDRTDRHILKTIAQMFNGGPVGLNTLSAALPMEKDTLEDVYEPFLIQQGYLQRTPKGRITTERAYRHLGMKLPTVQPDLFASRPASEIGDGEPDAD